MKGNGKTLYKRLDFPLSEGEDYLTMLKKFAEVSVGKNKLQCSWAVMRYSQWLSLSTDGRLPMTFEVRSSYLKTFR
jgi:hypothetical protein